MTLQEFRDEISSIEQEVISIGQQPASANANGTFTNQTFKDPHKEESYGVSEYPHQHNTSPSKLVYDLSQSRSFVSHHTERKTKFLWLEFSEW